MILSNHNAGVAASLTETKKHEGFDMRLFMVSHDKNEPNVAYFAETFFDAAYLYASKLDCTYDESIALKNGLTITEIPIKKGVRIYGAEEYTIWSNTTRETRHIPVRRQWLSEEFSQPKPKKQ